MQACGQSPGLDSGRYTKKLIIGDDFLVSLRNNASPAIAAFRTEVDNPIGRLHDIQIVLNHHDGVAAVAKPV